VSDATVLHFTIHIHCRKFVLTNMLYVCVDKCQLFTSTECAVPVKCKNWSIVSWW